MSLAPANISIGSVIITSDVNNQKFAAVELKKQKFICDNYQVWETGHEGVLYFITDGPSTK